MASEVADCGCTKRGSWVGIKFFVDIEPCDEHAIKFQFLQQKIDALQKQADETREKYTTLVDSIEELRREGQNIAQFKAYTF